MVSLKTLMQNRQPCRPGWRPLGRRIRRAVLRELRRHPEARPGAVVPRAVADLDRHPGARAVPEPARSRGFAIPIGPRIPRLRESCDAFVAGGHGAPATRPEAFGGAHAPDAGC